ncbi:MAG: 4Fe-4S dicluster domain-containing protein, partial [Bacteroidia bacterium]|nr:4Fe-4S dicluster domain-containing protein [Bacteroidia bacterium]
NQIQENNLIVLGITKNGELIQFSDFQAIEKYVNENKSQEYAPEDRELLEKLEKMTLQERWDFWQHELSRCIKCYACRAACPMCYCSRCTVDCNQPQWIPVGTHSLGNLDWHITRAMHVAGRCVTCSQCGEACPLDIPVHLLNFKIAEDIYKMFGSKAGFTLRQESSLSNYNIKDKENFII